MWLVTLELDTRPELAKADDAAPPSPLTPATRCCWRREPIALELRGGDCDADEEANARPGVFPSGYPESEERKYPVAIGIKKFMKPNNHTPPYTQIQSKVRSRHQLTKREMEEWRVISMILWNQKGINPGVLFGRSHIAQCETGYEQKGGDSMQQAFFNDESARSRIWKEVCLHRSWLPVPTPAPKWSSAGTVGGLPCVSDEFKEHFDEEHPLNQDPQLRETAIGAVVGRAFQERPARAHPGKKTAFGEKGERTLVEEGTDVILGEETAKDLSWESVVDGVVSVPAVLRDVPSRILDFRDPHSIDLPDCSPAVFRRVVLPFYDTARPWQFPMRPGLDTGIRTPLQWTQRAPGFFGFSFPRQTIQPMNQGLTSMLLQLVSHEPDAGGPGGAAGDDDDADDHDLDELTPARIDCDLRFLCIPSPFDLKWSLSVFFTAEGGREALERMKPVAAQIQQAREAALDTVESWRRLLEALTGKWDLALTLPFPLQAKVQQHFRFDELTAQADQQSERLTNRRDDGDDGCVYVPQACPASDVQFESEEQKLCMRALEQLFGLENIYFKRFDMEDSVEHHYSCYYRKYYEENNLSSVDYKLDENLRPKLSSENDLLVGNVADLPQPDFSPSMSRTLYHHKDLKRVPLQVIHHTSALPGGGKPWTSRYESCSDGTSGCEPEAQISSDIGIVITLPKKKPEPIGLSGPNPFPPPSAAIGAGMQADAPPLNQVPAPNGTNAIVPSSLASAANTPALVPPLAQFPLGRTARRPAPPPKVTRVVSRTAFTVFAREKWRAIQKETPSLSLGEMSEKVAQAWKALDRQEKNRYTDRVRSQSDDPDESDGDQAQSDE
ncbi:hypothetical protein DFJ73DRAFT_958713 [Zopfochytrium polystomum]|nr:hypothetical protein DFJ73DRAFT_958713 [Zopfochytrium polystomum]